MRRDATAESNRSPEIELQTRSTTNTQMFLETCVLDVDHKALEEHLTSNTVQQSDLDKCLLRGLGIVQEKERELSQLAPALTVLLQSGAKWNNDTLLDEQKTPYHIICDSPGDHHELLDLMIKSSQRTIIDRQDIYDRTASLYAVRHANLNCLKCLVTNGADVTIGYDDYRINVSTTSTPQWTPIMEAILNVCCAKNISAIKEHIFDLLLDIEVDNDKLSFEYYMLSIIFAVQCGNVYCIKKLIEKAARLNIIGPYGYVWSMIARLGNVELLKFMFNHGVDKNYTDQNGVSILVYVVDNGNIEAVRYLLDIGVDIPPYTLDVSETRCEQCKENTLIVDDIKSEDELNHDPCLIAICCDELEIVKLFDQHGSQTCKSFNALRCAVMYGSVDVTSYLLNKYTYPLNMEYINKSDQREYKQEHTLLTELQLPVNHLTESNLLQITKLLLAHGADPVKEMCSATSSNAIMTAIQYGHLKILAHYIRSGVDINFRSNNGTYEKVLPFEASVLRGNQNVAKLLLLSGCSCGVFSFRNNHQFKEGIKPQVEKLVKEWKVHENKVISLQQRCRIMILNHLYPRADMKIENLPLPRCLIKLLSIPELDVILEL